MDRIFGRAEDKYVRSYMIYGKDSDEKAYADSACTVQLTTSELRNAFMKGCVVKVGTSSVVYYYPVSYSEATQIGTLTCAKTSSSAFATLAFKSKKDPE